MKRIIAITIIIIAFIGCEDNQIGFDKNGWNLYTDGQACPPLREFMTKNLLSSHKIKGLTYQELINKLGKPDNNEFTPPNIIRYELTFKHKFGDIFQVRTLDFCFSKDSIINSWKFEKYNVDL